MIDPTLFLGTKFKGVNLYSLFRLESFAHNASEKRQGGEEEERRND